MAVTQISKIQVRYGLQEDIGTLTGGEFAWAIDTQRLFIGNGLVEEGAPVAGITEIMTASFDISEILGNYTYKGFLGGYEVVTGDNPVVRSLQDKIDDFVNVRDFGVSSTGNVDETQSLQLAIDELYSRKQPVTGQRARRILRLNAGTYRIDGELFLPPYLTLQGEGMDSVRIVLNGPSAKLTTTTGGDPSQEINIGTYPSSVTFKGLTFQRTVDDDTIIVDGSNNIVFEDVAFLGPRTLPNTIGNGSCVIIRSTVKDTEGIKFNRCKFSGIGYAVQIESARKIKNIIFDNCKFNDLWTAIRIDDISGTVEGIKISGCHFENIYSHVVYGSPNSTGIASIGNIYTNCASGYEGDQIAVGIWQPIIVFQSNGNYSFMDVFSRSTEMSRLYPRVSGETFYYAYLSLDEYFALGSANSYAGKSFEISDGNSFNIATEIVKHGIINYSMERGNMSRTGTINFVSNGNIVDWAEDYTESDDLGVLLNLTVDTNTNKIFLNGATVATGETTKLSFDLKNLA
jgi:hypothetical protein